MYDWFLGQRGITKETLERFGVEETEDGSCLFPYGSGSKYRGFKDGEATRNFWWTPGTGIGLFTDKDAVGTKTMFLCEGESDTMRLAQEMGFKHTALGLSGINGWRPGFAHEFERAERVYVILDNDSDYKVAKVVDSAWRQIRLDLGPKARRVLLPPGTKDLCEFFETYDLDTLEALCKRTGRLLTRFQSLDLSQDAPPVDWLVEGLIAMGDVHLLAGDPGLGKSWLTMDLACRVASPLIEEGWWLGKEVNHSGTVLYIDEENPEDIVRQRFRKLGLHAFNTKHIHYLHRPGIWMNKDPDAFLDEALALEPTLIVLDSLSRIHSEDENSANAMAGLFRNAIQPLARETGAAVVVIHHVTKTDTANSFQRVRGSGDISAVVDTAFDVRGTGTPGRFTVEQYKSRRTLGGEIITVQLRDEKESTILDVHEGVMF